MNIVSLSNLKARHSSSERLAMPAVACEKCDLSWGTIFEMPVVMVEMADTQGSYAFSKEFSNKMGQRLGQKASQQGKEVSIKNATTGMTVADMADMAWAVLV